MSYFEDFEEDKLGSIEYKDIEYEYLCEKKKTKRKHYYFEYCIDKWKTRDGELIEIRNMTTNHIINALNMISKICIKENLNPNNYIIFKYLKQELDLRKSLGIEKFN